MAQGPRLWDRVRDTTTTTGTGTVTLANSAPSGFRTFGSVLNDGDLVHYCIQEVDANGNANGSWETGIGTYTTSGTTLARTTVLASSNSGSATSFAAGTKQVFCTMPADFMAAAPIVVCGAPLPGAKFVRAAGLNMSLGDNDLYTCPTGRRAILLFRSHFNATGGTVTLIPNIKISGTYYKVAATFTSSNGFSGNGVLTGCPIADAGQIFSFNVATTAGLNAWLEILEYDATSGLKAARLIGPSNGDNTIYTCPAGKSAIPYPGGTSAVLTGNAGLLNFLSDGSRNVYANIVNSGGSPGSTNKASATTAVTAGNIAALQLGTTLGAGDFINLNVDVGNAAQFAWINMLEV